MSAHSRGALFDGDLALLLILGMIWGSAFPVIRFGLLAGAAPFPFAAVRYGAAAVLAAMLAVVSREALPDRRTFGLSLLLGGGFLIGGYAGLLYWGEGTTSGGLAAVFIASAPLWSALFAFVLLPAERITWRGTLGIVLGFVGLIVLFLPVLTTGGIGRPLGALSIVGAAVSFSIGSVLLRRTLATAQGFWTVSAQFAMGAGLLSIASLGVGEPLSIPWNTDVLLSLGYLIVLSSVVGYWIYFRLHHRVGPARANVVSYVNPIAGIAVGVALLGEGLGVDEVAGALLILVGLLLLHHDR